MLFLKGDKESCKMTSVKPLSHFFTGLESSKMRTTSVIPALGTDYFLGEGTE